jgi:hypothetical protein
MNKFMFDMTRLLGNQDQDEKRSFHDVVFKFGCDRRSFKAHSSILLARSPVFKKTLIGVSADGNNSCAIEVPDIDPDVFFELLRFLYTGTVDIELDKACELLASKFHPIT